jgi:ABC-2 type transport system ATP-binding protein
MFEVEICLRVQHVSKAFDGAVALKDISLDVPCGHIFALLGPNGSGKTTLVKIVATLLAMDSGSVSVLGQDIAAQEARARGLIGYVGQDSERSAYARLSVRENLRFFGALRGLPKRAADAAISRLAAQFAFERELDKAFMILSGGQKQTAVILRALLTDPPLILLDEPTKGLDAAMARRIRTFLSHYVCGTGRTILLTSHTLSEVDELSDRVALMHAGAIAIEGTAAALKDATGWQGVLDVPVELVTEELARALANAGGVRKAHSSVGWASYGLRAGPFDFTAAMEVMARHRLERAYRYRPVSLEDALEHQVGRLAERFEP